MDKAMVNSFFKREYDKLTTDTNKHISLVKKSLNDMNNGKAVDVSQHTDIDINAKTDSEVEAISLDDELTKKDMANGYQDEVQSFENEYAKAEPIPEEPYNGDIRPDEELDTYAGMATKEEGDDLITEMAELDPEIKADMEALEMEMKAETAPTKEVIKRTEDECEKITTEEEVETKQNLDEKKLDRDIKFERPETIGALLCYEHERNTQQ